MRVIHEPAGENAERRVIATDVEVAEGLWNKFRGLRLCRQIPDKYALVFPFDSPGRRDIDMLFVRTPIDVIWLIDEHVQKTSTLRPWIGFGLGRADCVIEVAPGRAREIHPEDRIIIES